MTNPDRLARLYDGFYADHDKPSEPVQSGLGCMSPVQFAAAVLVLVAVFTLIFWGL
jgi:hypothetical protein